MPVCYGVARWSYGGDTVHAEELQWCRRQSWRCFAPLCSGDPRLFKYFWNHRDHFPLNTGLTQWCVKDSVNRALGICLLYPGPLATPFWDEPGYTMAQCELDFIKRDNALSLLDWPIRAKGLIYMIACIASCFCHFKKSYVSHQTIFCQYMLFLLQCLWIKHTLHTSTL